jgi:hypothetical protein
MKMDNSTALGVVNSNIQPRQTKAMDMRFYWLQDRATQQQFKFFWLPGKTGFGEYWTKHHCAAYRVEKCGTILTPLHVVTALRESLQRNPNTTVAPAARLHLTSMA